MQHIAGRTGGERYQSFLENKSVDWVIDMAAIIDRCCCKYRGRHTRVMDLYINALAKEPFHYKGDDNGPRNQRKIYRKMGKLLSS